jgi:hypothetical protein
MERLVAWYRVGSSWGAVAALVVANAIPLFGVLFLGWNVWTILTIYWLENGVVGFFNVLKMSKAAGTDPVGPGVTATVNGRPVAGSAKAVLIPFFIVHYGIFWLVHGIFILALPMFQAFGGSGFFGGAFFGGGLFGGGFVDGGGILDGGAPADGGSGILSDPGAIAFVLIGLFISHGISYRLNYIGRGEYLRTSVVRQMAAPYGRLVILHVTIILGGMAIALTGAPAAAVLVLVLLKTALDLGFHLAEHREPQIPVVSGDAAPGPDVSR